MIARGRGIGKEMTAFPLHNLTFQGRPQGNNVTLAVTAGVAEGPPNETVRVRIKSFK